MCIKIWKKRHVSQATLNTKLVLGTVQMGLPYGINNSSGRISEEESIKILKKAYESGINELDSAETYGSAHRVIGTFHVRYPGLKFSVITKIPNKTAAKDIKTKLRNYKEMLNVETLKAVLFHSFESYRVNAELKDTLFGLKETGLFTYLGVSIYTNEELEQVIRDEKIDLVQLPFNLFDNRSVRGDLLEQAKKEGKIVYTRSAFLQGLFFKSPKEDHSVVQQLTQPLSKIRTIAEENGLSIAGLALQYCLNQEFIDHVIIGVDSLKQLNMNLEICNQELSRNVMEELDNIQVENKNLLNPSLWP